MTETEIQIYTKKREALISAIEGLVWFWDIAPWILVIVNSEFVTPELLDVLFDVMTEELKKIKSEEIKEAFNKSLNIVKELREKELQEKMDIIAAADKELSEMQLI